MAADFQSPRPFRKRLGRHRTRFSLFPRAMPGFSGTYRRQAGTKFPKSWSSCESRVNEAGAPRLHPIDVATWGRADPSSGDYAAANAERRRPACPQSRRSDRRAANRRGPTIQSPAAKSVPKEGSQSCAWPNIIPMWHGIFRGLEAVLADIRSRGAGCHALPSAIARRRTWPGASPDPRRHRRADRAGNLRPMDRRSHHEYVCRGRFCAGQALTQEQRANVPVRAPGDTGAGRRAPPPCMER